MSGVLILAWRWRFVFAFALMLGLCLVSGYSGFAIWALSDYFTYIPLGVGICMCMCIRSPIYITLCSKCTYLLIFRKVIFNSTCFIVGNEW